MFMEKKAIKNNNTYSRNMEDNKELNDAVALAKHYNAWRRDDSRELEMPNPTEVGKAIDILIKYVEDELQQA